MPFFGRFSNSLGITRNYLHPPVGQQAFTTVGTFNFVVPIGVTSICAVCIGGGGGGRQTTGTGNGGGGGGLRWINNLPVTPGESLTVTVGSGGYPFALNSDALGGNPSQIARGANVLIAAFGGSGGYALDANGGTGTAFGAGPFGGTIGGGNGGTSTTGLSNNNPSGGGGAGGYSGNGGTGGYNSFTAGSGGGGAGGAGGFTFGQGGGGVGIFGEGASGTAARAGGSGGGLGQAGNGNGGLYGGGGGGKDSNTLTNESLGAQGAVRIIWGSGRAFPNTNTIDL